MFSHRIHRTDWQRCSPTEFTEFTERTGRDVLPQNSRNSQNRLVEMFSHRFHRFSQMLCFWSSVNSVYSVGLPMSPVNLCKSVQSVGGLFRLCGVYSPTEQTGRDILPQISQILTDGAFLEFCEFCVFCGTSYAPSESVRICEICGRITETSAPSIGLRRQRGSRRAAGSG